ncbi:MAG: YceI family protein [Pseudomonadota bacterium]
MRRFFATLALFALASLPLRAEPYVIDPDHTAITFQMNHLGFSTFFGRFNEYRFEIDFDPDDIEGSSVRVEIDAASIDTGSATRDRHARDFADLLNTDVFPTIRYESTRIELTSAETVRMTGDLTIRRTTLPVTFDVRLNARGVTPLSRGKEVIGLTATGLVDRVAFDMGFAAPAVTAEIPVRVDIEMMPAD